GQCLSAGVLSRLQNQENEVDEGTEPLRMAEVFRALTDGVWSELALRSDPIPEGEPVPKPLSLSTIRRNLQREHLRRLCEIVLGRKRSSYEDMFAFISFADEGRYPSDARSLARMHLKEIS